MKKNVNIFSILLSFLLAGSSSLFAQMDPALVEGVEGILSLEEFREALNDHPTEGLLVVHREVDAVPIQPQEAHSDTIRAVAHGENGEVFERVDAQTAIEQKMSSNRDQALRIYCMHWLIDVGATKTEGSTYAKEALARGAEPQLVEAFKEYCEEVNISLDSGGFLALSWIQVAEDIQQGIEDSIKAHDVSEATYWNNAAQAMQQVARYKAQLIKASVLHYTPEVASLYKEIVAQYQTASKCYQMAAKQMVIQHAFYQDEIPNISWMKYIPDVFKRHFNSKNRSRASIRRTDWDDAAKTLISSATQLTQAAKALIKSNQATIQQNPVVVTFWNTMAIRYKELTVLPMPENTATYVYEEANSSPSYALNYHLFSAANVLEKAAQAMDENNSEIAIFWKKIALQHQRLGILWKQYSGKEEGKKDVSMNLLFTKRGSFHLSSASKAVKEAVQCMAENNPELTELWQRIAQQYQKAAKYDCKATTADHGEDEQWSCAVNAIEKSADQLRSAISALEKAAQTMRGGNKELTELWQKASLQYQEAGEYYEQASLAAANRPLSKLAYADEVQGIPVVGGPRDRLRELVSSSPVGVSRAGASESIDGAEKLSVQKLLDASSTGATKQFAAELELGKSSNGETTESDFWFYAGDLASSSAEQLFLSAEALKRSAKVITQNYQLLEELWNKQALQHQEIAHYFKKSADAMIRGNASEITQNLSSLSTEALKTDSQCPNDKYSVNPSETCDRESTDHQSSFDRARSSEPQLLSSISHLPSPTAAAVSTASIRPAGRIVTFNAAISAKSSDSQLCNAKVALLEATKAIQQGNQVLAEFWQRIVLQYQEAAECYLKAAEAYAQGNEVEGDLFDKKGVSAQEEAKQVEQEAKQIKEAVHNP